MSGARCPLCESSAYKVIYDLRLVTSANAIPGRIARCSDCSLEFKIVAGSASTVRDAYGDTYSEGEGADEYLTGDATRAYFRKVIGDIGIKKGRLLDIGTGQGVFVEEAKTAGYEARGIDLCAALVAKAQARGVDVQHKAAEDLDTSEGALFDVVTMMDLIEHVPDPLAVLATVRKLLKPKGELVVYTPNHRSAVVLMARALARTGADFAVREIFGSNHLTFFDDRTLRALLSKAGFSIRKMKLFPYDPTRPGQPLSPVSLAAVTVIEQLGRPFNRMFRMLAYAENAKP